MKQRCETHGAICGSKKVKKFKGIKKQRNYVLSDVFLNLKWL